jgi:raffinose/stachyose/melibiose transport system permease protein
MDRLRYRPGTFLLELTMIGVAALYTFPLYVCIVLAFKPESVWRQSPLSLPWSPYFGNFSEAWVSARLGDAITSSMVIVACSLVLLVIIGSAAAYFIARAAPRVSWPIYMLYLGGMTLPFQLALIPLYAFMRDVHLLGTPYSVIMFNAGINLPLTIFLYAGYIRTIPLAYEESARIDGAGEFQIFSLVVFPMLRPVTGTVLIIAGVFMWNDFMIPLLYLSGSSWATIPVRIYSFVDTYVTEWGNVFASLLIGIAPVVIVFLLLQKHMIKGFVSGVKG